MIVNSSAEMETEAARFARGLAPRTGGATVVTLSGELGTGKTAFVKGVAKALGVTEHVTSPTFVIMKMYPVRGRKLSNGVGDFERLVHIDAYRLKGEHHLKVLGWDELLEDPKNLIFMEWPEKAQSAVSACAIRIRFSYSGDNARTISYEGTYEGKKEKTTGRA